MDINCVHDFSCHRKCGEHCIYLRGTILNATLNALDVCQLGQFTLVISTKVDHHPLPSPDTPHRQEIGLRTV